MDLKHIDEKGGLSVTCTQFDGLLDRLMDGQLTEEERRAMDAHAQTCPTCARAMRSTLEMKALFDEMEPEVDVPLAAQARWRSAIRDDAGRLRRKRRMRWFASAAAAVVVLVGVGLMVRTGAPGKDATSMSGPSNDAQAGAVYEEAAPIDDAAQADAGEVAAEIAVIETDGEALESDRSAAQSAPMAKGDSGAGEASEVDAAEESAQFSEIDAAAQDDSSVKAGEAAEDASSGSAKMAEAMPMATPEATQMPTADQPEAPACNAVAAEAAPEAEAFENMADMAAEEEPEEALTDGDEAEEADAVALDMPPVQAALTEAVAAPLSPACELSIRVSGVENACGILRDLADEFEGTADVQSVEDGSANVYVRIDAKSAPAFLKTAAGMDETDAQPTAPQVAEDGPVLILLVISPIAD